MRIKKVKRTFESVSGEVDGLIRSGKTEEARTILRTFPPSELKGAERLQFAKLCRRAQLPELTLRALNPLVRPSRKLVAEAQDEEKVEYAGALIKIGAIDEAKHLLIRLLESSVPQVHLYLAFAHVAQWNYKESIQSLHRYLEFQTISDYERTIGKLNLLAALIYEGDFEESSHLLRDLKQDEALQKQRLLYGHLLQLSTQFYLFQDRFSEAKRELDLAEKNHAGTGGVVSLFIQKWRLVIKLAEKKMDPELRKEINRLKDEARKLEHWETLRDVDRFLALKKKDLPTALFLYFGTPYESYRAKIKATLFKDGRLPEEFVWRAGNKNERLKVVSIEELVNSGKMKPGQLIYRLLATLVSDFYRPQPLAALFAAIYPKEFYNPKSSPQRLYQALHRFRKWVKQYKLPFELEEIHGEYRLRLKPHFSLSIPNRKLIAADYVLFIESIRDKVTKTNFTADEASEVSNEPRWLVLRHLQRSLADGLLSRTGKGKGTRYWFGEVLSEEEKKRAA